MKATKITLATISLSLAITVTVGAVTSLLAGGYNQTIFAVGFIGPATALLYGIYLTYEWKGNRGKNVFFWLTLLPLIIWIASLVLQVLHK